MTVDNDPELARLRWRCRRGLLELDLLFERFLDRSYAGLTPNERAAFAELLQFPDTQLLSYLQGNDQPPKPEFQRLVNKIRQ